MYQIVCNTGPIIHLHEANLINLLNNQGKIFIPVKVENEILSYIRNFKFPQEFEIIQLSKDQLLESQNLMKHSDLHEGESEAIVLARFLKANWFLTDDYSARVFAGLLNIETHGSLGVISWNIVNGFLSKKQGLEAINNLKKTSIWLTDSIYKI